MIKTTPHKIAILMGVLLSPSVFATDINVEFTATVKATTCNITLTGNNVTNDGNNNYTLRIPKMGLDKIDLSSTTSNIGMGFKKRTTDDATFLQPNNSADKIRWSTEEMQPDKGLEMTVALRETAAGQGVPGIFRALATFNFIYQ